MLQSKEKFKIMRAEDLPFQIGKEVQMKGISIILFRLLNGDIRAVENHCPHKNGPLAEGIVSGEFVFCPLHDWKISLVTGEVQKPDDGCIQTYEVEVIDGDIYIYM
ncbi:MULTISPECIES: nitrite reductase small subunit NirD [Bacillus]|uniref:nitrite reductase small subunit NirD n=1 Tax=Bacillus TaxID=1386 RepID=UPI001909406F|nr:nitrite reductase small subunit NirD [Bacillus cereus]MBK4739865.1 nitrite reductase small subunit NirD [Bacillus cereus]MCM3202722.1 nitrite reductase small subunit NirD [Bacillus cereus]MCU7393123.1 nitrite reductase small subunit NirD [Bacillus sp. ST24]